LDIYWDDGSYGTIVGHKVDGKGGKINIDTVVGHKFYWTVHGRRQQVGSDATIQSGVTEYTLAANEKIAVDRNACQDRSRRCTTDARNGECLRNPGWMIVNCARSCGACDLLDPSRRCDRARLNVSTEPAYGAGDLARMFAGLEARFPELEPTVVSDSPWIVTFDKFMNASETDALIAAVGAESGGPGFVRSTDTGAYNKFGEAAKVVSSGRTSENAWCRENCDDKPLVRKGARADERATGGVVRRLPSSRCTRWPQGMRWGQQSLLAPRPR